MKTHWTHLIIIFVLSTTQLYCQTDFKKFLDLFPAVSVSNLHVYSPCDKIDGKKFEGRLIDKAFHNLFSFDQVLKSNLTLGWHVFSCFKFKYSSSITGLIVRTPSQNSETSIDLFLWDNQQNKIIKRMELADAFGDGYWHFVKEGWLMDINKDGLLDIVNRKKDLWKDDPDDKTEQTSDTLRVFVGTGQDFKQTKMGVDKNKFELMNWERK